MGDVQSMYNAFVQIKAELEPPCVTARFREKSGSPNGVRSNTGRPSLAGLHSGGCKFDECLEQLGCRSPAAVRCQSDSQLS